MGCTKENTCDDERLVGNYWLKYTKGEEDQWFRVPHYTGTDHNQTKRGTISGELGFNCDFLTAKQVSGMYEWGFWRTYTWFPARDNLYEITSDTMFRYQNNFGNWKTASYNRQSRMVEIFNNRYVRK